MQVFLCFFYYIVLHFFQHGLCLDETVVSYLPDGDGPFPEGDLCGSQWYSVLSPGITTADEVTFTLVDTHSVGSRVAYRDFLKYMFVGRLENVKSYLTPMWQGWRYCVVPEE